LWVTAVGIVAPAKFRGNPGEVNGPAGTGSSNVITNEDLSQGIRRHGVITDTAVVERSISEVLLYAEKGGHLKDAGMNDFDGVLAVGEVNGRCAVIECGSVDAVGGSGTRYVNGRGGVIEIDVEIWSSSRGIAHEVHAISSIACTGDSVYLHTSEDEVPDAGSISCKGECCRSAGRVIG